MSTEPNKANNAFTITGNWEQQSKNLQQKFSQLTDGDVKFEKGKEEELLSRVEKKLNKNRDEVINIINKCQPTS